jgi:serine/threonine protein kinase
MQFQYNSDYPGGGPDDNRLFSTAKAAADAANPPDFPPAHPIPCARITTRVFHPNRNQVATVQNVLVRTVLQNPLHSSPAVALYNAAENHEDSSMSSSDGFSDSNDDDSMLLDDGSRGASGPIGFPGIAPASASTRTVQQQPNGDDDMDKDGDDRAYWIQRTIRDAIYGHVFMAVVLRRRVPSQAGNDNAEWEVTAQHCAVKEMSWQHIRKERDRLAEDPIKEVSAMQYLVSWHRSERKECEQQVLSSASTEHPRDGVSRSVRAMVATNIMMPLDLLSDDRNLYSVMPYCNGGELFERLDMNERFSEPEARYWMNQVLNGIETLQNAGICHRDMSLENLLVHENGALIIDLGMCLRVPVQKEHGSDTPEEQAQFLSLSFDTMNMNGNNSTALLTPTSSLTTTTTTIRGGATICRKQPRRLITPQGTCGKWIYMSPEIYKNAAPFDGFAVDMWAAGVILFLMLTGFPPWERACQTDERFKYMTAGYLVQMLTEWDIGLSPDAMDLLQRMLFLDPKDRLSLEQVRAHPWMVNGPSQPPAPLAEF